MSDNKNIESMNNYKLFKRLRDITVDLSVLILAHHFCNDYYTSNGQHFWSLFAAVALILLTIPFLLTNLIALLLPILNRSRKLVTLLVEDEDC